ncbi:MULTISPECIES: hypothetical protein [unclassified Leifsonia]|uniref:hypothetical protein n=1 Tax=unclassified Leifsonia TaxID=2663824 RepID=UPI00087B86B9|nr:MULTISPECIES: hypothetical protein [unclassified Leifsonia]SDJ03969.1 hypothetical protein SAMN04515684_1811 [Leifsonia sp. 466MF]SDJ68706.1 hypothetical protein SAMN04515683_0935 [Leifsonia sp. 157MF]SDO07820.1 hypothetical protein SAMN04515686_4014 [Leifsonia sp. 509MF]SEM96023.1 hypothetical protein SAMN04515685_0921 [Leifsonia sp. 467MF]
MSEFQITLPILEPDEPPRVDVHYEWRQYALWLSGRYGLDNVDGHEIGLSPALVRDLLLWTDTEDALFNEDDPANSPSSPNFRANGFELAKRVRAELPSEWIVTTFDPDSRKRVVLPLPR